MPRPAARIWDDAYFMHTHLGTHSEILVYVFTNRLSSVVIERPPRGLEVVNSNPILDLKHCVFTNRLNSVVIERPPRGLVVVSSNPIRDLKR